MKPSTTNSKMPEQEPFEIVFLSRKPYNFSDYSGRLHRVLENEDEVVLYIKRQLPSNWILSISRPELLNTIDSQAEIFKNAKFLVGSHGAGLTNLIFMKPGSHVIEFFFDNYANSEIPLFANMCTWFKLNHHIGGRFHGRTIKPNVLWDKISFAINQVEKENNKQP